MPEASYQEKLAQEAEQWGRESEQQAQSIPPDWRYHRHLRHNAVMHTAKIDAFLSHIQPGMRTLELGCASGWLTLAMAQRGAHAEGLDISEKSLGVARAYFDSIRDEVGGTVNYRAADLNTLELPAGTYDVIATKGTLHHLIGLDHLIDQIYRALKPGGLFWVSDANGDEALTTVLVASGMMFVLPTHVNYRDKLWGLARFGLGAPSRVKASMQAEGLSPFEGAGRAHDWLKLVCERFAIERRIDDPAFTGYITAQLRLPDTLALPLLKGLRAVDGALVRVGLLRGTGITLYARKATN